MKKSGLSVSNLAWPDESLDEALGILSHAGATGIEVAPTRLAPWDELTPSILLAYRERLAQHGLVPSSLQAIFFGAADAQLLGDAAGFQAMAEHVRRIGSIAEILGVSVAVFGAPRNRGRGSLEPEAAFDLAAERLLKLGAVAAGAGLVLGMEPVPVAYKSDFLLTWQEVLALVTRVGHPAIRLHLDTACVSLGGGAIAEAIEAGKNYLTHFHAAQPALVDFADPLPEHDIAGRALDDAGYRGWVAIEMMQQPHWQDAIAGAISVAKAAYLIEGNI